MSSSETSIRRLDFREKSGGDHTRRIGLNLLAAIVAAVVLGVTANGQTPVPIAADAFRASAVSLRSILPTSEIDQGPQAGAYELQIWSAGGDGVRLARSNPNGSFRNIGLRFGYVLTGEHGPGPLRGRFEYVADVIPLIEFHLPGQTAWGGGIVPVGMKWDFVTRHRIAPYVEVNGGGLVTNNAVPPGGSMLNFTPRVLWVCMCCAGSLTGAWRPAFITLRTAVWPLTRASTPWAYALVSEPSAGRWETRTNVLKISVTETKTELRWILEGRLAGPWVTELRKSWKSKQRR